jgi:flagellar biosynthetic protein FliO
MGSLIFFAWQTANPSGDIGWVGSEFTSLLRLVLVLAGILILAFFVLRFAIPRFFGVDNFRTGPITVVARYSLEPRKSLYIVQVGTEFFLVGTSETNVQFLTSLDAGKVESALAQSNLKPPEGSEFARLLRGLKRSQKP